MMKQETWMKWLAVGWKPLKSNALFFVMMYLLGCVSAWVTLGPYKDAKLYDHLYTELFFDLYLLVAALTLVPDRWRRRLRLMLYVVFYGVALVDAYCYVTFSSTLNPSMLMLVGETNGREAWEFLTTLVSPDLIFSNLGWILLLIGVNLLLHFAPRYRLFYWPKYALSLPVEVAFSVLAVAGWVACGCDAWENKVKVHRLMSADTIGEVEHTLTNKHHGVLYNPMLRLVFSLYANDLASHQVDKLVAAADKVSVDSCSFRSPTIVLIIGESYGRHHSHQYGYALPTTPRQERRARKGFLVPFTDVVAPWNLTSYVFKNVFSMHVVGQQGEWCDYPLFPEIFKKAGYKVTFLTNQFLMKPAAAVFDFSGGFFLNNPTLNRAQFDLRNTVLHRYDAGLLQDYDDFLKAGKIDLRQHNLIIFHLIGQHMNYRDRYPPERKKFVAERYERLRPELTQKQRMILADYDNAVRYNDSIVDQICRRFANKDAIVIYMPDHGEECYEENRGFFCRNHSAQIDWPLAHYEFEIPFWIYCAPRYAHRRPELFRAIVQARKRRLMTDALPHMLLYLAGISAKDYHAKYNVLSDEYDEARPRLLKGTADYDALRTQFFKQKNKAKHEK